MKTFKDNSGVEIRAGQLIRYQGDLVLRVINRSKKLFCVPIKTGKGVSISLETLCEGKDVCDNVDIIAKRPLL